MALTNSNISYTGLVEKYIGTAYDKMAAIYDNLPPLLTIAEALAAGYFDDLVDNIDEVIKVIEELELFNALYYGAHPSHPVPADGVSIIDGALYFNTTDNLFYVYANGEWNPAGGRITNTDNISINAQNQSIVTLPHNYVPGSKDLMVFVRKMGTEHPVYQYSSLLDPVNFTYHELTVNSIQFVPQLDMGDIVTAIIGIPVASVTHAVGVNIATLVNGVADVTLVTLPGGLSYTMGNNSLQVFADRQLQIIGLDYEEITNTEISYLVPQASGIEHHYRVGNVVTNAPASTNVILQDIKPDETLYAEGTFWVNTSKGRVYILVRDIDSLQWMAVAEEQIVLTQGGIPAIPSDKPYMVFKPGTTNPPDPALYPQGTFWLDTETMKFHILFVDVDTPQWIEISARNLT